MTLRIKVKLRNIPNAARQNGTKMNWLKSLWKSTPANRIPATRRSAVRPELDQFGVAAAPRDSLLRSFKPAFDQLEERLVMSHNGLITSASDIINYPSVLGVTNVGALHQYALLPSTGVVQENIVLGSNAYSHTGWVGLTTNAPGPFYQISAGRDDNWKAECFGITGNREVWVYQESLGYWRNLGRGAPYGMQQISAADHGTVYAQDSSLGIWQNTTSGGWQQFTGSGPGRAYQVSAGETGVYGANVLWVIDLNHNVQSFGWGGGQGWRNWGGWAGRISGTVHDGVYTIGMQNDINYLDPNYIVSTGWGFSVNVGPMWVFTGGYGSAIDAGTDNSGQNDRVFQIGLNSDHAIYEYSLHGPQAGWTWDGGNAVEIAATAYNPYTPQEAGSVMLIDGGGPVWLYSNWSIYGFSPYAPVWAAEGGYWL